MLAVVCESLQLLCLFFFFLIPQSYLQLVKNDPLKLVNVFHSFPLTSHSCDRRCPSGVGTAHLPRGSVAWWPPLQVWGSASVCSHQLSIPLRSYTWLELGNKSYWLKDWRSFYSSCYKSKGGSRGLRYHPSQPSHFRERDSKAQKWKVILLVGEEIRLVPGQCYYCCGFLTWLFTYFVGYPWDLPSKRLSVLRKLST